MEIPKIHESEYRFCLILWEHEPVTAVELVKLCHEQLGWKRNTTYTVIKHLGELGVLTVSEREADDTMEWFANISRK